MICFELIGEVGPAEFLNLCAIARSILTAGRYALILTQPIANVGLKSRHVFLIVMSVRLL
jgi:hypothetical protein